MSKQGVELRTEQSGGAGQGGMYMVAAHLLRAVRLLGLALAELEVVRFALALAGRAALNEDRAREEAGRVEEAEDAEADRERERVEAVDEGLVGRNRAVVA